MSNEGYADIILHLTHIHEPGGGNQWGLILGFMLEMDAIKQTFLPGIPLTGRATWTATLTLIR